MSATRPAAFVLKAAIPDDGAAQLDFPDQKTMYAGKAIAAGDAVFLFSSETSGGTGFVGEGVVSAATATPPVPGLGRQTPRVSVRVARIVPARRPLGRADLKRCSDWNDGRPETELNFKLYRQATDKIVGVSGEVAAFLRRHL